VKFSLELLQTQEQERDPYRIDAFAGTVRAFRLYLAAQRVLLKAGVIE
jgi:hypothetical protein